MLRVFVCFLKIEYASYNVGISVYILFGILEPNQLHWFKKPIQYYEELKVSFISLNSCVFIMERFLEGSPAFSFQGGDGINLGFAMRGDPALNGNISPPPP